MQPEWNNAKVTPPLMSQDLFLRVSCPISCFRFLFLSAPLSPVRPFLMALSQPLHPLFIHSSASFTPPHLPTHRPLTTTPSPSGADEFPCLIFMGEIVLEACVRVVAGGGGVYGRERWWIGYVRVCVHRWGWEGIQGVHEASLPYQRHVSLSVLMVITLPTIGTHCLDHNKKKVKKKKKWMEGWQGGVLKERGGGYNWLGLSGYVNTAHLFN